MFNETKADAVINVKDNINKEDVEYITKTLTYVNLWLTVFVIIIAIIIVKIIVTKVLNTCKRAYTVHKERVIRQHNETITQA